MTKRSVFTYHKILYIDISRSHFIELIKSQWPGHLAITLNQDWVYYICTKWTSTDWMNYATPAMTVKQWCLATKITYFHNLNLYGMLYYNVYTDLVSNSPNYQLPLTLAVRFVTANWNFSLVLEPAIWPALATLLKAPFSQLVPADTYLQVGRKYRTIEGINNEKLERLRWSASAWWFLHADFC